MRYIFHGYALDTDIRELRLGDTVVPVTRQVFDLLEYLIRNRARIVSKDDLVTAIWNGRAITDTALTTRLNAARRAIGDSGEQQRLIKTVPRVGYRFVGDLKELRNPGGGAKGSSLDMPKSISARRGNPSIAVLRFANVPGGFNRECLADGIAENLVTGLTRVHWLHVIARQSGFRYDHEAADVRRIGEVLGVRYVLEGSVRDMGGRCRVSGMLIDAGSGVVLWIGRYDRDPAETSNTCDDITEAMTSAVVNTITGAERQRAIRTEPERLGAWEAHQRGMWHMSLCEPAENAIAQTFFQRAIDLDPNYSAGHGALGWSHMMAASIFSQMTIDEGCALAEPLVRRATALDENDMDSRARLAIADMLRGDLEAAYDGARRVLSVDPNCAEALGIKGTALLYSGRRQEGREAIRLHLKLSPRDPARPIRLSQIAASLYLDGDYSAALTTASRVVRRFPKHPTAYRWLAASLGQLGRTAEAEAALHDLLTISPSSFDMYIRQRPRYCGIEYQPMLEGLRKAGWKD